MPFGVVQLWLHVISWSNLIDSKNGGIVGGGRISAWDVVHMAAALAYYRTAMDPFSLC